MNKRSPTCQALFNLANNLLDTDLVIGDQIMVLPAFHMGDTPGQGFLDVDQVTGLQLVAQVLDDDVKLSNGDQVSKSRCLPLNRAL